jgi:TnpA family transposase
LPRRSVLLSDGQRTRFGVPATDATDLVRHYTLEPADLAAVHRHRGDHNRLGVALQLCYLRFPGRVLRQGEQPPEVMVRFVAEQVGADAVAFERYGKRDQTRREHLAELQRLYGFQTFSAERYRELAAWLLPTALDTGKGPVLVAELVEEIRRRRIILPSLPVVERLCSEVRNRAERQIWRTLATGLTKAQEAGLDGLLAIRPDSGQTWLTWLRQPPGAATVPGFLEAIERLQHVRTLGLDPDRARGIHRNRLVQLASEAGHTTAQHLADLEPRRRYGTLSAMALEMTATLTDDALVLADKLIGALFRKAEHRHAEAFHRDGKAINDKVRLYARLGQALIAARQNGTDAFAAVEAVLPWEQFVSSVAQAGDLAQPEAFDHLGLLADHYPAVRRWAPLFLASFTFKAAPSAEPLLGAITILRRMNADSQAELPAKVPTAFVWGRWRAYVFPDGARGRIDRRFYELCVLAELRDRLRAGDIWVVGSRQYRDFEEHLISRPAFQEMRRAGPLPLALDAGFRSFLDDRRELMHERLSTVAARLGSHDLPDVRLGEDGILHISPVRKAVPDAVGELADHLYARLPRVRITELLQEVDRWTRFTEAFTHLRSGAAAPDPQVLLTGILADALNLGLGRMAEACPVASLRQLIWTTNWHIREDAYGQALARIVDLQHRQPLTAHFGSGTTSSSDGQRFQVGGHGGGSGEINAKYGQEPGVKFYSHVSDRYSRYSINVIAATSSEAPYVMDGLLYHEANLDIREHYTDTAGAVDSIFALCTLLGFRFAPRIRDLQDRRLYTLGLPSAYPVLEPLIGGRINAAHLEAWWEEVLRLATSVRTGTVLASTILRKLAAYPRQNGLALALRELGRIERTLFTLDWVQDPALRRRVTAGLNKGEACHALARAVCFHRLGEIRDRSYENQRHRASGLNLVVAAITLWNAVYLGHAVDTLRAEGTSVPDELLSHLSPLGWEHINLTGDYVWASEVPAALDRLRSLRSGARSFLLAA